MCTEPLLISASSNDIVKCNYPDLSSMSHGIKGQEVILSDVELLSEVFQPSLHMK